MPPYSFLPEGLDSKEEDERGREGGNCRQQWDCIEGKAWKGRYM